MTLKLILDFLFSQHFRIYLVVEPQPKYKTRNLPNLGSISKNFCHAQRILAVKGMGCWGQSVKE